MMNPVHDEIVEEIRRRREAHAASLEYDLSRIVEDLRRQEREAGVQVVTRPSRRPVAIPKKQSA